MFAGRRNLQLCFVNCKVCACVFWTLICVRDSFITNRRRDTYTQHLNAVACVFAKFCDRCGRPDFWIGWHSLALSSKTAAATALSLLVPPPTHFAVRKDTELPTPSSNPTHLPPPQAHTQWRHRPILRALSLTHTHT